MNKKIIVLFVFMILVLVIIAITIIAIINSKKNTVFSMNEEIKEEAENGSTFIEYYADIESEAIEKSAYFDIKTCMNNYCEIININSSKYYGSDENGNKVKIISESDIANTIFSVLSEKYIKENNITKDNTLDKIKTYEKETKFVLIKAETIQGGEISSFLIQGLLVDYYDYTYVDEISCIINLDIINNTFSIEPMYENHKNKNELINSELEKNITDRINNRYKILPLTYITEAQDYIERYKILSISNPEIMYNLLSREYREKRFGNLENYKIYVEKNKDEIKKIVPSEYTANSYKDYYEHVIKDQYGNLYIIDEKAVLDYTIKLDTYTLDNDKFNSTYKTATNKDKVLMNLDKFFQMLNANDYKSSYAVLDDKFKATYFPTEESFENFVKQYMYPHANVKYTNFSDKISGVFTYYIELTNKANEKDKEIGMNVVMQLQEGTNFKISFEIVR